MWHVSCTLSFLFYTQARSRSSLRKKGSKGPAPYALSGTVNELGSKSKRPLRV